MLEPVLLQTSRSVTPCIQTNRTPHSLGQDSLSLPQSEVLICSFYLCPFLETFQPGESLFLVPALLATTSSQSCSYNLLLGQPALPPTSEDFCEAQPCSWDLCLALPRHSHRLSPRRISLGKINPCSCFNSLSSISRSCDEKEQRRLG